MEQDIHGDGGRDATELLDESAEAGEVRAGPAVLLREVGAQEPHLAEGSKDLQGELVRLLHGLDVLGQFLLGEAAHRLAEHDVFLTRPEVDDAPSL